MRLYLAAGLFSRAGRVLYFEHRAVADTPLDESDLFGKIPRVAPGAAVDENSAHAARKGEIAYFRLCLRGQFPLGGEESWFGQLGIHGGQRLYRRLILGFRHEVDGQLIGVGNEDSAVPARLYLHGHREGKDLYVPIHRPRGNAVLLRKVIRRQPAL